MMKYLALLALILAAPALADEPNAVVEAIGAVFVFTDCGMPVAFELLENDNYHIRVVGDPDFTSVIKQARAAEATGAKVVFIELREHTGCGLRSPSLKAPPLPSTYL